MQLCLITLGLALLVLKEGTSDQDNAHAVQEADIDFYFFDNNDPSQPFHINVSDINPINGSSFSSSRDTIFITHGFTESYTDQACQPIKDALITKHDVNVIIVDWTKCMFEAYSEIVAVGNIISSFIKNLVERNNLQLDRTSLVGFSLGAHIMGVVGKDLDGLCGQVIGLDPAGPGFYLIEAADRLSTSCGHFVQVIHTNGDQFAYNEPLGHADYYPNGGKKQHGCELDVLGVCNHLRSTELFAESILTGNFRALKCDNYTQFEIEECRGDFSFMGGYPVDKSASGTYFLDTNSLSPFARG
ncbi:hypothetical protein JTB14_021796 [Gonioctena quinquepunctata]|nr:hypothetical protein JTB14_021796 [Gonioctena quinquepunctata]